MSKLRVSAIQRGCVYDGPGVRTTIFLKGCTLHCPWCCNPENISLDDENFIDDEKCLFLNGINSQICKDCERRDGKRPILNCPLGVSVPVAQELDSTEVFRRIMRDKDVFCKNGGVTFSGGEPLLQAEPLVPILQKCNAENINIMFETTLFVKSEKLESVMPYTDGLIVDLKLQPEQGDITKYLELLRANLMILDSYDIRLYYRLVFVNSMLGVRHVVLNHLQSLNVKNVELLKCHNLGKKKYEKLHKNNSDFTADEELFVQFSAYLNQSGIMVSLLKV